MARATGTQARRAPRNSAATSPHEKTRLDEAWPAAAQENKLARAARWLAGGGEAGQHDVPREPSP